MRYPILSVTLRHERDVVAARQSARQIAALVGFDIHDQTRIATAVSEVARKVFLHGCDARVEFGVLRETRPQALEVCVRESGSGLARLEDRSGIAPEPFGLEVETACARRLVDQFTIESLPGTASTVRLVKNFPDRAGLFTAQSVAAVAERLKNVPSETLAEEVHRQNEELVRTLDELRRRQDELLRLNKELEETNRGVVALYAELDEKADHLRRADEMKSRFLSNMSHEFRTPLNSILALSRLLLDRTDGPLTVEQDRQLQYIRKGAEHLSELVNDLLDLAKVEAGKVVVHPTLFDVAELFGTLRGMLRPLLVNSSVDLVFESPVGIPRLYTDEAKVSQILRNFLSNALKFTEKGHVRASATLAPGGDRVVFSVTDTGIGIAREDQERIFQEFGQLENPIQKRVRGTGLGLPLSKKLAELLGGRLSLESAPGQGSRFSAVIPITYGGVAAAGRPVDVSASGSAQPAVLVVDSSPESVLVYERYLQGSAFRLYAASSVSEARILLEQVEPAAIVLDLSLGGEDAAHFVTALKESDATRPIPIAVVSTMDERRRALALGAAACAVKPVERHWLLETLARLIPARGARRVLIIDDDAASRYMLRRYLPPEEFDVIEAASGPEGLQAARDARPWLIFLDLLMPGMNGLEVLDELESHDTTSRIPVVIVTSKVLDDSERRLLNPRGVSILPKEWLAAPDAADRVRGILSDVAPMASA
jgi:signal transduction histidine kinase/DNA-binding response OmpR family regulator